ncbi:hypothetical protein JCM8547_002524 [Rhodosporidiobolus lusitaniae]
MPAHRVDYPDQYRPWPWHQCKESGPLCKRVNLDFRIEGDVLRQCSTARVEWGNSSVVPKDFGGTWEFFAQTNFVDEKTGKDGQLAGTPFALPSMSMDWLVDFPEGTSIMFELDTWHNYTYYHAWSQEWVVQAPEEGNANCIPASHTPIFTHYPESVFECEPTTISWTGGASDIVLDVSVQLGIDSVSGTLEPIRREDGHAAVVWDEPYPAGSVVRFALKTSDDMMSFASTSFTIKKGKQQCYIPPDHRVRESGTARTAKRVIIAVVSLAGLASLGGIGYGVYKAVKKAQEERRIRLE